MKVIIFKNVDELINKIVFKLNPLEFVEFNKKLEEITSPQSDWRKKFDKNNR